MAGRNSHASIRVRTGAKDRACWPLSLFGRPVIPLSLALLLLGTALAPSSAADRAFSGDGSAAPAGIVLEAAEPGGALERAGLRPGDLLVSWRRAANPPANPEGAGGVFANPFDAKQIEVEQAPRGALELCVLRGGLLFEVAVPPGKWLARSRPQLGPEAQRAYEYAALAMEARAEEAAGDLFAKLARDARDRDEADLGAWYLLGAAEGFARQYRWTLAKRFYEEAFETSCDPSIQASIRVASAAEFLGRISPAKALDAFGAALGLLGGDGARSLAAAFVLNYLGIAAADRGDLLAAQTYHRRALAIREGQAPGSLPVAVSLDNLGTVVADRGDLEAGEAYLRRGKEITERLVPGSTDLASCLNDLGIVLRRRGDLAAAEAVLRLALEILEARDPGSLACTPVLNSLGNLAQARGDLEGAEAYFQRALEIRERLAPGTRILATNLNNLGGVAHARYDLEGAEIYYRRALEIHERSAPDSLSVATCLNNLGEVARNRRDLDGAEAYFRRSMAIKERLAPGSLSAATSLQNLGNIARHRGDLDGAEELYRRALEICDRCAPESLPVAASLSILGEVSRDRGDLGSAEALFRRALEIQERLAPGSAPVAKSSHFLACTLRDRGDVEGALVNFEKSVNALESQMGRFGGVEEARLAYRESAGHYYREYIDLLMKQGLEGRAFHVLERSRARQFLILFVEREILFGAEVPPELDRERRALAAECRNILEALNNAAADGEKTRDLQIRLEEAHRREARLKDRIRQASPRLAALQYPDPVDAERARRLLDPGTLLLTWAVGQRSTHLFALTREGVETAQIPIGKEALDLKVRLFRHQITGREEPWASAELSDLLLGPAERAIAGARRLLIVPDGPLYLLPFGALRDPAADGAWLVERIPIQTVVSVTVYGELRDKKPGVKPPSLVAFGDPLYPSPSSSEGGDGNLSPAHRACLRAGMRFDPLPWTRGEVDAISRLYPGKAVVRLGEEATEEAARSLGKGTSVIHFACHGYANEQFPLESGLVLSIPAAYRPGEDNGFLQAWEIFEKLSIDADLVTLSACATGLGRQMGGEGMVGLSRAFHYAGARSVLSTLWMVSDASTAELMRRFYRYLGKGMAEAEALRLAQVDMIRSGSRRGASGPAPGGEIGSLDPEWAHPFHWAGFVLNGLGGPPGRPR